jgi:hypothetical protein
MTFITDTSVVHKIRLSILLLVDDAQIISEWYCINMLSSKDTDQLVFNSLCRQTTICCSETTLELFIQSEF